MHKRTTIPRRSGHRTGVLDATKRREATGALRPAGRDGGDAILMTSPSKVEGREPDNRTIEGNLLGQRPVGRRASGNAVMLTARSGPSHSRFSPENPGLVDAAAQKSPAHRVVDFGSHDVLAKGFSAGPPYIFLPQHLDATHSHLHHQSTLHAAWWPAAFTTFLHLVASKLDDISCTARPLRGGLRGYGNRSASLFSSLVSRKRVELAYSITAPQRKHAIWQ